MSRYRRYGRYGRYRSGRRYYRGPFGGVVSGLALVLAHFAILLMLVMVLAFDLIAASVSALFHGGGVFYDEKVFETYVEERYAAEFAGAPAEDNILIVVLVEPDGFDYYYKVKVGGHIDPVVADLFVGEDPEFADTIYWEFYRSRSDYKQSIGSKLVNVMGSMKNKVWNVRGYETVICEEESPFITHFVNDSELEISQKTVDRAVENFASNSAVSTVVVVADMEDVFGKTFPPKVIITLVLLAAAIAGVIAFAVYAMRHKDRFQGKAETPDPDETIEDHEKLENDYWKDRY
ncbi:MAG: hypothetical protein J6R82_00365 [Clostridia bacterium]|nr:hypothetical protein [Clostridia bacterium]